MARAYTAELRDRVLRACERGGLSRARVAALFGVGESTLYRWQQTWRTEGRREARPHAGGPAPRLGEAALDRLKELVARPTTAPWPSTRPRSASAPGWRRAARPCAVRSGSSASRAKKALRAAEQDRADLALARAEWRGGRGGGGPRAR